MERRQKVPAIYALLLAALGAPGCSEEDCEQSACAAVARPRGRVAIAQGIAGVIAYQTDACTPDCCECNFDRTELTVYRTPEPVTTAEQAQAIVSGQSTDTVINARASYEQALETGDHLVCNLPSQCAALRIDAGEVFTVNVKLVFGPPRLIVFAPGAAAPREELLFDVKPN